MRLPSLSPSRPLPLIFLIVFLLSLVQIGVLTSASIGGAGSFDDIFLTGLVAVLLA